MTDKLTPERRSANMAAIRSKNTKPEMVVRRLAHSMGFRYRLHRRDLPGQPDLVFPGRRKIVQVHGCYWHGHDDSACPDRRQVKSNTAYWGPKIEGNKVRDTRNEAALRDQGWAVLVIWECETRRLDELAERLRAFLG